VTTYLSYLGVSLVVPLVGVAALARRRGRLRTRTDALGVAALVAIAVSYTFVWDGFLIRQGVWWYGDGVVTRRVGVVPVGELSFMVLQTMLSALWLYAVDPPLSTERPDAVGVRGIGLAVIGALELGGLVLAFTTSGYYLGYILMWGGPVLGFLWFVGGPVIWRSRRAVAVAIAVPTAYLWVVDWVAIDRGLWVISAEHSTGLAVAGLPIEEMAFFLVTNCLVVFGLLLYQWVALRAESRGVLVALLGLLPRTGVEEPVGAIWE
jgi:lycopene cyclase domain-containing protein